MTSQHDPFNTRRPTIHELGVGTNWISYPISWLLMAFYRTWRMHLDAESCRHLKATKAPRLIVIWHNRSFVIPEVFRRYFNPPRIACLISPSKAAAWEVALFKRFRLRSIRGSTTRRGIQAVREMLRELKRDQDVVISPDGPSGPPYIFKEGAVAIARSAGVPVLAVIPNASAAWRPRTWDRHLIPLPFARIDVQVRAIPATDRVWEQETGEIARTARRVCLEITRDPFTLGDDG